MTRSVILVVCFLLLANCGPPGDSSSSSGELSVTCIANEGFLVAGASGKVLVDALFSEHDYYDVPSDDLGDRMIRGDPPFDGIDVVLATHHHGDHFDAPMVAEFLRNHPESVFLSTPQAVEEMKENCPGFHRIADRVHTVELAKGESGETILGGIPLWVHSSGHSGNRPGWQNFMYAFDVGEWTVFHEGDSPLDRDGFAAFRESGRSADIAFLHSWFMTRDSGLRIVEEQLQADRVILMHIPVRFRAETLEKLDAIRGRFPEAYWLEPGSGATVFRPVPDRAMPH